MQILLKNVFLILHQNKKVKLHFIYMLIHIFAQSNSTTASLHVCCILSLTADVEHLLATEPKHQQKKTAAGNSQVLKEDYFMGFFSDCLCNSCFLLF